MSVRLCVCRGSEGTYDGIVRGEGSGLMLKPASETAIGAVSSSVENLTAGFTLLGDVSVVERSTIRRLGVRFRREELVCISLVVAVGTGRSFRSTDGSRVTGYSMTGLLTSTADRP